MSSNNLFNYKVDYKLFAYILYIFGNTSVAFREIVNFSNTIFFYATQMNDETFSLTTQQRKFFICSMKYLICF